MTRNTTAAALLCTLLASACVHEEEQQPAPRLSVESLGGAWTSCVTEQEVLQDQWETFFFDGTTMQRVAMEYASTDASCTGAVHGYVDDLWEWTGVALADDAATTLAGAPVTARVFDTDQYHTIAYVDAAAEPDRLYLGDPSDPAKDGSTPETRPTVLWDRPFARDGAALGAKAIEGTWGTACIADAVRDHRDAVTFRGYELTVATTSYDSTDGSCTGGELPQSSRFVLALRDPVSASFGGGSVTARALDWAAGGVDGGAAYTIVYVDRAVTPNVLYLGDDTGARDGTTPEARPNALHRARPYVRQ